MSGVEGSAGRSAGGSTALAEADLRALVALNRLVEPPSPPLVQLVEAWGPRAVVEQIRTGETGLGHGIQDAFDAEPGSRAAARAQEARTSERLTRWRERLTLVDVDRDLMLAARVGARLVSWGDAEWPRSLDALGVRRPLCLWVRGSASLAEAARTSVAVVGARACTAYGEHLATSLGSELGGRGWTVVSGGAFGIDAAAHRGTLRTNGTTVAVLACGVDLAYPRAHDTLLQAVTADGLVVSEYALGTSVTRGRFLERNRLLAALTLGTVLVEAGIRSGARSTVKHARLLNRPVLVVPGPVTSPASAGCHEELRHNALDTHLVTDADDVIEVLGPLAPELHVPRRGAERPLDALDPLGLRVFDAMPRTAEISLDALAMQAEASIADTLAGLGALAAAGLAEPYGSGWRRRP